MIENINIGDWVSNATGGSDKEFREAVHTILAAIVADPHLQADMVIKGGILLAIRYQSGRFTKDIDFSTMKSLDQVNPQLIEESLNNSFAQLEEDLRYGLACLVQSCTVKPKNKPEASFPSISIVVGYAYKGTRKYDRLLVKKSTSTISIDYSLNELMPNLETIEIGLGGRLSAYSFADMIAEKLRSLLQQKIRNRVRRQDVFDLFWLLGKYPKIDASEKSRIFKSLIEKSRSRGVEPHIASMDDPEIRKRTQVDYETLADEVEGELPGFDSSYDSVNDFYKSLPWG